VFGLGLLCGLALLFSAVAQGTACAAAINASKNKPEVFGISLGAGRLDRGFAVFAFVFALLLAGRIPQ
jgi:V/A-type H+/Na+-transporting ATPase subunit K